MTSVLITAFEPYGPWAANSSWLTLVELTRDLPSQLSVVTRRYPVDFGTVRERLAKDLEANYDFALHLGQAPQATAIQLEAMAINVAGLPGQEPSEFRPLVADGPVAYRSPLPLGHWAEQLRASGIPAQVSYHAGTYLCNAALYLSCYLAERMSLKTRSGFLHLPLDVSQAASQSSESPSLPVAVSAAAVRLLMEDLAAHKPDPLRSLV